MQLMYTVLEMTLWRAKKFLKNAQVMFHLSRVNPILKEFWVLFCEKVIQFGGGGGGASVVSISCFNLY